MQWDDENDDLEEGADDENEDEQEDELADLDDATRARVEAAAAKAAARAVDERMGALRSTFQASGFDLAADGTPLIRDPAKVAAFAAPFAAQPARPELQPAASATADEEDEEEIPDPVTDRAGFLRWQGQRDKRLAEEVAKQVLAQVQPEQQRTADWRRTAEMRDAEERVMAMLPGTRIAEFVAPENVERFLEGFRGFLQTTDPESWRDDDNLYALAGATIAKVFPRQQQQRDASGRWASPRAVNAQLYHQSLQQHPDSGRQPRGAQPTQEEQNAARIAAAHTGRSFSVDEVRAMDKHEVTYEEYRRAKEAAAKRKGKGG